MINAASQHASISLSHRTLSFVCIRLNLLIYSLPSFYALLSTLCLKQIPPARIERATYWFEASHSIQLSYGGIIICRPFLERNPAERD